MRNQHNSDKFDADVTDLAHTLASVDFSSESPQRENTRTRLMQAAWARRYGIRSAARTAKRRWSPVYALASLATGIALLALVIAAAGMIPFLAAATPTPEPLATVQPLNASEVNPVVSEIARLNSIEEIAYYDTLLDAQAALNFPLYAPSELPEGYILAFVAVPGRDKSYALSVYFENTRWRAAAARGETFDQSIGYLYIAQSATTDEAQTPLWQNRFRSVDFNTENPNNVGIISPDGARYSMATFGDDALLHWTMDDHKFTLSSSHLTNTQLFNVAQSLESVTEPGPRIAIEIGAAGSCADTAPGTATVWASPMSPGTYTVVRGFSDLHPGIDLAAAQGTMVYAANSGRVVFAGLSNYGYGLAVIIAHGPYLTLYGQLSSVNVGCGQEVETGQMIGAVGSTGNASGPHLHFEILNADGVRTDPASTIGFDSASEQANIPSPANIPNLDYPITGHPAVALGKVEGAAFDEIIVLGSSLYALDKTQAKGGIYHAQLSDDGLRLVRSLDQIQGLTNGTPFRSQHVTLGNFIGMAYAEERDAIVGLDHRGHLVICPRDHLTDCQVQTLQDVERWVKPVAIQYWQNRLYILDPGAHQIWRYDSTNGTFDGALAAYFAGQSDVDITNAVDFAIQKPPNGGVFILMADGTMQAYLGGERQEFRYDGLPNAESLKLDSASAMSLDESVVVRGFYIVNRDRPAIYEIALGGMFRRLHEIRALITAGEITDVMRHPLHPILYITVGDTIMAVP